MNALEELKENSFKTQGAKDFIEIAKGFHRLFNQDAAIAKALKPTTGGTIGSSIATSVGGAAQFQVTKAAFGFIVRTLPYIPFAKALNDKVSGAALRYHIKAALNKSHSIEAFKQNLNKIANRAEFSNATKALIREIEQNLPKSVESGGSASSGGTQVSKEGRALESEADVKARGLESETPETGAGQKLEGRGLQNEQEARALPNEGTTKITPNPAFGKNFEEFYHDPKGAIAKLIETKEGQVAGAFYREDLGDIDLVWGNSKMGLAHILERRTQQYGEEKALEFVQELPRMVQESKIYENTTDRIELITPKELVVIGKRDQNRFIITGFNDRRSKNRFKQLDNLQSLDDAGFTSKSVSEQPKKVGDILLPNQEKPTTPPLKSQEPNNYIGVEVIEHPKLLPFKSDSQIYKEA
ncbi:putative barnase/colicin E5 family endoribonuclease, partial [Helicobacter suis]